MGVIAISCTIGLAVTGMMINWGPFRFLHSWDKDVNAITEKYSIERQEEIIFYGASNFALWEDMEEDLNEYKVQNHAFGGSTDADLLEYADQLLYPYQPQIVFFQTGSNDYVQMSGTDEEKVAQCMENKKKMFTLFHEKMPEAHFVIMSGLLLPGRSQYLNMTLMINEELKVYAETVDYITFIDANDMTWDGKQYNKELFRDDMIHLNHKGALEWCKTYIKPEIERLIKENEWNHLKKEVQLDE